MPAQYKYTHSRTKKKGGNAFKKIFGGLALALLIGGMIYALFFCPIIRIQEVKVSGVSAEIESQIWGKVRSFLGRKFLLVFPGDGIVLFDSDKLTAELEKIGAIKSASVRWNMPNSIEIKAEERLGILNWCFDSGICSVIDGEGLEISNALDASLPIVNDSCGSGSLDKQKIKFIEKASELLYRLGLKSNGFYLENCFTLKLAAKVSGFEIYFDLSRPVEDQVNVLQNVLVDKSRIILEYIDLQVEGRVYYK